MPLQRVGDWPDAGAITRAFAKHACNALVSLLDPDNETEKYELVLQLRRNQNGRVPRANEDHEIFPLPTRQASDRPVPRSQTKAAISDAMEEFGVSRATVYNACTRVRRREKKSLERASEVPPFYVRYD
jgi:hypothetical protein